MTLLGEKLKAAGVETADARLMVLAIDALRESKGAIDEAAIVLWTKLQQEPWVAMDLWLLPYLRDRQRDMAGPQSTAFVKIEAGLNEALSIARDTATPSKIHVRPKAPSPESKARIDSIIKRAVQHIQFGYKTSDGTDWAQIGAHELDGMDRDGAMARAVKARIGVLTNEDRFRTVGDLMTAKQFNEVVDQVRRHPIKEILK